MSLILINKIKKKQKFITHNNNEKNMSKLNKYTNFLKIVILNNNKFTSILVCMMIYYKMIVLII